MLHANFMAVWFTEPERRKWGYCSCDLYLDPMTFISELNPYSLEIYRMCKYELYTSRLSKVIVWQTDIHTYIHTYRQTDRQTRSNYIYITTSLRGWSVISQHIVNGTHRRSLDASCLQALHYCTFNGLTTHCNKLAQMPSIFALSCMLFSCGCNFSIFRELGYMLSYESKERYVKAVCLKI